MAGILGMTGMVVGSIGIFFGFYFLANKPLTSLEILTITTVGIVGVLAYIRHFIFHKSDAKRLGWETDRPDWIFEVGFANLAFGFMGIFSVVAQWGKFAMALTIFGYALYLFQAGCLHGYRYFTDEKKSPARLWRATIPTLLYAGMMVFLTVLILQRL